MIDIRITVDDEGAQRTLAAVIRRAGDLSEPMRESADVLEQRIRQTFRDAADPWGMPWAPLSDVTLKQRARRGNTRQSILLDRGYMYASLRRESNGDSATVSMGGPDTFPAVHQFGSPDNRAWGGAMAPIPARPMFPIRESGADLPQAWADEVIAPIAEAMEAAADE